MYTDANGVYTFRAENLRSFGGAISGNLYAGAPGYFEAQTITVPDLSTVPLPVVNNITLRPGGAVVKGVVRDANTHLAIASAKIIFNRNPPSTFQGGSDEIGIQTQADGTYTIDSSYYNENTVVGGFQAGFHVSAAGYLGATLGINFSTYPATQDFNLIPLNQPPNHAPIANAGPNQTVSATNGCQATVAFDGTGSSDPDGDSLTYIWTGPFGTVSGPTPTVILSAGVNKITLTVNDGRGGTASADVFITVNDRTAPETIATRPSPNSNGWYNANVIVSLNASDNCPGVKQIFYSLAGAQSGNSAVPGSSASITISTEGATTLTYFAQDNTGNLETSKTIAVNIDKTAPTLTCSVSPQVISPANGKLIPVTASVAVSDLLSGPAGFTLFSIVTSEPVQPDDIQDFDIGTPDTSGLLRADKSSKGAGLVYNLIYRGMDVAGNSANCSVTVTVPHDQSKWLQSASQ